MGCDIHFNTEIKKNGVWRQNTDAVFPNPDYELNGKYCLHVFIYYILWDKYVYVDFISFITWYFWLCF